MTIFSPDRWRTLQWLLVFCMVFSLGLHTNPARSETEQQLTREQLNADLSNAYELLKKIQPNFTAHKSTKELKALRDRLIASSNDTNSLDDAYLKLTELIGAVCDEHTYIEKSEQNPALMQGGWQWHAEPLIVHNGKLYIESNETKRTNEVLEINGIEGPTIAAEIAKRVPSDGCFKSGTLFVNESLVVSAPVFDALVGKPKKYQIKYLSSKNRYPREREVTAVTAYVATNYMKRFILYGIGEKRIEFLNNNLTKRDLGPSVAIANLDYRISQRRNIAYVDVGEFDDLPSAKDGIELVMRDIIKSNPEALFLDLTASPGGSVETAQFMMAFLLPRAHRLHSKALFKSVSKKPPPQFEYIDEKALERRTSMINFFRRVKSRKRIRGVPIIRRSFGKPDYKGPIVVLVGPSTHSSATMVAANLRRLRKAKIVDNLTASDVATSCTQASGFVLLEHSKFRLHVPELCFQSPKNTIDGQSALVPDIAVDVFNWKSAKLPTKILRTALEHFDRSREIALATASAE